MDKDTLELLLFITQNAYAEYLSVLSEQSNSWTTDRGEKYPLMLKYEKAIAELKSALDIDK